MAPSEEKVKIVGKALSQFADMPGFPKNDVAILAVAKAYSKFVHNKSATEIYSGHSLGEKSDLEWLCEEIWDKCQFFPKPIESRGLHEQKFPPADGLSAADLAFGTESGRGAGE